jgi:uncharacterized lipoprotein NlpE involved in copper resistance
MEAGFMKKLYYTLTALAVAVLFSLTGCGNKSDNFIELEHFGLNAPIGSAGEQKIILDKDIKTEGNGSWRIEVDKPAAVRIAGIKDIDINEGRLVYEADIRTDNFDGQAYLEMWCQIKGQGRFFGRDIQSPIEGDSGWTTEQTVFFLKKNQILENIDLNLVIEGTGTVWIDNVYLYKSR